MLLCDVPDLAERVLGDLPLASLAALQCTCKAAGTAVARLPEALWQVSIDFAAGQAQSQAQYYPACCRQLERESMRPSTPCGRHSTFVST